MRRRYDRFGYISILLMAVFLIVGGILLLSSYLLISEKLIFSSGWVVISFFIMVGVEGNARGIPRDKVPVPWKLAAFSLILAIGLLAAGGILDTKY